MAAQLGRGVDAVLGHDDQHLELRGGNAVGFHVGVDDPILEQGGAPQQETEVAIAKVFRGEMFHLTTYWLPRQ
ncbi:hypothetical protein D3C81_1930150 [compost metagenome]